MYKICNQSLPITTYMYFNVRLQRFGSSNIGTLKINKSVLIVSYWMYVNEMSMTLRYEKLT